MSPTVKTVELVSPKGKESSNLLLVLPFNPKLYPAPAKFLATAFPIPDDAPEIMADRRLGEFIELEYTPVQNFLNALSNKFPLNED